MKRFFVLLLILLASSVFGGTREDMERLQAEIKALQSKFSGLGLELQDIRKRLENIESRLDAVSRSSQTADVRLDLDEIRRKVEALEIQLGEIRSARESDTYGSARPQRAPDGEEAGETPDLIYKGAYAEYLQGHYENAVSEYQRFLSLYPDHPLAENCMYWIGESFYGMKKYEEAKGALKLTMEKYPKGAKRQAAKLKLALACYYLGEKAESKRLLQEIVSSGPGSPESEIAREKMKALFPE